MSKRLTKSQKLKNARTYRIIREGYNQLMKNKPETELTYKQFKNRVMAMRKATGKSTKQSIAKVFNTQDIVSPAERARNNLIKALRNDFSNEFKKITSLTRDPGGKFISKDKLRSKLIWTTFGNKRGYKFQSTSGDWYFIDLSNSPIGVNIIEI